MLIPWVPGHVLSGNISVSLQAIFAYYGKREG